VVLERSTVDLCGLAGQSRYTTTPNSAATALDMSTPQTNHLGTRLWYNSEGDLHRADGPAVEYANGAREWLLDGWRHREDGPAMEEADGSCFWYRNNQLHREDGPAMEWANGTRMWYLNNQRHRADGPAIEWEDGTREWWVNGLLHRDDGPAREWADGDREWWLNGKLLTFAEWLDQTTRCPQQQTLLSLRWSS
jgi:hypothetical protein